MKKYHSFGKSAIPALLATILIGATLGCSDSSSEDDPILQSIAVTGTYADETTTVETVSASNVSGYNKNVAGEQTLTVTVNDQGGAVLAGLDGLATASGGNTAANPVALTLSCNLANDSWATTLAAITASGKYVSLDLSACTMTNTSFQPGTSAGAAKIIALTLPAPLFPRSPQALAAYGL
ncbi:MAG: hypothetical protein LBK73_05265 [Treponema sp.]|jgi:hypothetical protein|nr:hypothetical protein [Treponema sp.]